MVYYVCFPAVRAVISYIIQLKMSAIRLQAFTPHSAPSGIAGSGWRRTIL